MFTVLIAVAVAGIQDVLDRFAIEGNEAKAVGDEFVREDRSVGLDFYKVDCHRGDFSENCTAKGICKGKGDVCEGEVDMGGGGLGM